MSVFARLKSGLARSHKAMTQGIGDALKKHKLASDLLAELEDLLIMSDVGVETSADIIASLKARKFEQPIDIEAIKQFLSTEIAARLTPFQVPLDSGRTKPFVILMTGVNGTGKTTTVGKLAHFYKQQGKSVLLVACDTFRAAAVEQIAIWGQRAKVPVLTTKAGGDAAGLAFDAYQQAQAKNIDIVLIDTAGRLHSNKNLMAELEKIIRVLQKIDKSAPHASLLVLDATTGQNAITQADIFCQSAAVNGLIMSKLDSTARGGILLAVTAKLGLPIHFIGTGEAAEDLQIFDAHTFAKALMGLYET
ncbi:MAG: signal recognition particle-docking protein FtsY [Alphaproteobacteria bacterium]|nr:signal recognition particle-docking protein FtsY [Alphaproteobacteria bacterium]